MWMWELTEQGKHPSKNAVLLVELPHHCDSITMEIWVMLACEAEAKVITS